MFLNHPDTEVLDEFTDLYTDVGSPVGEMSTTNIVGIIKALAVHR